MRATLVSTLAVFALAAGSAAATSYATMLPAPRLRPDPHWFTRTTGATNDVLVVPQIWATKIRSLRDGLGPADVFNGLRRLPPNGIVIWVTTSGRGRPNRTFARATLPLRLGRFRIDHGWEGQPAPTVEQRLDWVAVDGWHLDVRVYFGTQHPTPTLLVEAQTELDGLMLPRR